MYFTSALINGSLLSPKKERLPHIRILILYAAVLNCHRLDEPDSMICVYLVHMTTLSEAGTDEALVPCLDLATMDRLDMRSVPLVDHGGFQARSFYVRSHNGPSCILPSSPFLRSNGYLASERTSSMRIVPRNLPRWCSRNGGA